MSVVDRLAAEVNRTAGGPETGGVLLGRHEWPLTHIVDFESVPAGAPASGEYAASAALSGFEELIGKAGSRAVGYYRVQHKGVNQLTADDLALIERYFPGSEHVHMVLGPTDEGPHMAGVFFRENGTVHPVSFMEFACDSQVLRTSSALSDRPQANDIEEESVDVSAPLLFTSTLGPGTRRIPRWALYVMGGLFVMALLAAALAGFRRGQSEVAPQQTVAPPQSPSGAPEPGETAKLRETMRQIQQNLDTRLAENERMRARVKELNEKLALAAPPQPVKQPDAAPPVKQTAEPSTAPSTASQSTPDLPAPGAPVLSPPPAVAPPPEPARRATDGPRSGKLIWTGYLAPGATVMIEGRKASAGAVNGTLPASPLLVTLYPAELSSGGLTLYSSQQRHSSGNVQEKQSAGTGWLPVRYVYEPERVRGVTLIEAPTAENAYKLTLRGGSKPESAIVIEWRIR